VNDASLRLRQRGALLSALRSELYEDSVRREQLDELLDIWSIDNGASRTEQDDNHRLGGGRQELPADAGRIFGAAAGQELEFDDEQASPEEKLQRARRSALEAATTGRSRVRRKRRGRK